MSYSPVRKTADGPETMLGRLFRNIYRHQAMIVALAIRDLQSRYAGTFGGMLWTFAHPVAVVSIFYVVFAVGFKSQGAGQTPFVLWFVSGFVPWLFFNETLMAITDSVTRNAHFVKKTVFPSEILPLVHVTSGLIPHVIFLLILVGMLVLYKVTFFMDRLWVVYFLLCACALLLGLGWLLSALQVFYRDISHGLSIVLNLWFWATPIVWSPANMPEEYRSILLCNPMYYIVEGYRGLMIYDHPVWPGAWHTVYFWILVTLLFAGGTYVFARLKPEFADVM